MFEYDLLVIGGGSGGVRAARIAASHGARVALVEEYRLGGTCVIRGCVPKKLMVYASRFAQEFEEALGFGWSVGEATLDWPTLRARRDQEVARLEAVYRTNLVASGVTLLEGRAVLQDRHTVRVEPTQGDAVRHVRAERILIATGATPAQGTPIPGQALAIDSNGFFDLATMPRRVVVQGAGYIALELASVLNGLGAQVHVVVRGRSLLRGFDADIQSHLGTELVAAGLQFHFESEISEIRGDAAQGLQVTLQRGVVLPADCVLRAVGRIPHTKGLGLEAVGVQCDAVGAILVDERFETNVSGIHAVGDVTNRVNLTPMAIRHGHAFADTVFGARPRTVDHTLIPTAVFTTPEVGVVGMTEAAALAAFPELDVYLSNFRPMKATLSGHSGRMLMKILVDRKTDRVLGFHSIGPDSGEMVQLLAIALKMQVTKEILDSTLAVHPTAAEEWVTMRTPVRQHNLTSP